MAFFSFFKPIGTECFHLSTCSGSGNQICNLFVMIYFNSFSDFVVILLRNTNNNTVEMSFALCLLGSLSCNNQAANELASATQQTGQSIVTVSRYHNAILKIICWKELKNKVTKLLIWQLLGHKRGKNLKVSTHSSQQECEMHGQLPSMTRHHVEKQLCYVYCRWDEFIC